MGHFTLGAKCNRITFCPGRGSNQGLLRANPTLYCVAVKAGLYRKAIQVCIIPSTTTNMSFRRRGLAFAGSAVRYISIVSIVLFNNQN